MSIIDIIEGFFSFDPIKAVGDDGPTLVITSITVWFMWKILNEVYVLVKHKLREKSPSLDRRNPDQGSSDQHKIVLQDDKTKCLDRYLVYMKSRPDLKNHYFFSHVNILLSNTLRSVECGCIGRTELFRSMTETMLIVWRDALLKFLIEREDLVKKVGTGYELGDAVLAVISDIREKYQVKWRQEGVPDIAIRAFIDWNGIRVDKMIETTTLICSSEYYFGNTERIASLLSMHEIALQLTVVDLNRILIALNGRLDGVQYRGYQIMPIKNLYSIELERELEKKFQANKAKHRSGEWKVDP